MKVVCFGEILTRLSTHPHLRFSQSTNFELSFAGSEANVAAALGRLSIPTSFVTALPANDISSMALAALQSWNVDTSFIHFDHERMGLFFLEIGRGNRASKIMYDRKHTSISLLSTETINWTAVFEGAKWFHFSGITPGLSRSAAEVTEEALKHAVDSGLFISCDLNFRANLWTYGVAPDQVMPKLVGYCNLLMCDGITMDKYLGIQADSYGAAIEETFKKYPRLQITAMTARQGINARHNTFRGYLHDRTQLFESKQYDLTDIVDRIGTGDAFMAGLIYAHLNGYKKQESVDFATALAALNHSITGDFSLISKQEVEDFLAGATGGTVKR